MDGAGFAVGVFAVDGEDVHSGGPVLGGEAEEEAEVEGDVGLAFYVFAGGEVALEGLGGLGVIDEVDGEGAACGGLLDEGFCFGDSVFEGYLELGYLAGGVDFEFG